MNMETQYQSRADGYVRDSLAGEAFKNFGNEEHKGSSPYSTQHKQEDIVAVTAFVKVNILMVMAADEDDEKAQEHPYYRVFSWLIGG